MHLEYVGWRFNWMDFERLWHQNASGKCWTKNILDENLMSWMLKNCDVKMHLEYAGWRFNIMDERLHTMIICKNCQSFWGLTSMWNMREGLVKLIYNVVFFVLVWTPCLMHRCVCIWQYILQNYNYKLHFQNLSIYHILHVFIRTLAAENLDVCIACDPWDSNIQRTMVKDQRQQIYLNCLVSELDSCLWALCGEYMLSLLLILISKFWGCPPWGRACLY
jgi:hypothetical protein